MNHVSTHLYTEMMYNKKNVRNIIHVGSVALGKNKCFQIHRQSQLSTFITFGFQKIKFEAPDYKLDEVKIKKYIQLISPKLMTSQNF